MKPNIPPLFSTDERSTEPRATPSHDEISERARELWEMYGRPTGRDEEIWLEAEAQLNGDDAKGRAEEARTPVNLSPPES